MRIALLTAGSRGDVQPLVALGRALARAGHGFTLVAPRGFAPLAREHGVPFHGAGPEDWPTPDDVAERVRRGEFGDAANLRGWPLLRFAYDLFARNMTRFTADALAACEGADAVGSASLTAFAGHSIAEKLGVPYFHAVPQPAMATRELPSPIFPPGPSWVPGYNRLTYWATERVVWRLNRESAASLRRDALGLAPYDGWVFDRVRREAPPVLTGVSPSIVPRPRDWAPNYHMTGYWFLDAPDGWSPPPTLAEFLASGPPPVCVGFGSMPSADPAADLRTIVAALERAGHRGIVLSGWAGLDAHARDLPATVLALDAAPHAWLFPRAAAVVHHGGAGTTAAAFRAGVPQVVVPVTADQPFWADRVRRLGAGPAGIPRKRLTAERLAAAIDRAVEDATRERARELGARVRAEDGGARAVEILERALSGRAKGAPVAGHALPFRSSGA